MANKSTLWMGDIEPWMNELVIKNLFETNGFHPKEIRFVKDKRYNIFQNYCFIDFNNMLEANNALIKLKGKKIQNLNLRFKLNWANKNSENGSNLYIGNIPSEATDSELYTFFKDKYPSVQHASIITENGISKRYGFVYFSDEEDYQKCLKEMNGAKFHNNIIKVKQRKKKSNEFEQIKINFHKINHFCLNNINRSNNPIFNQKINNNLNIQSFNLNDIKSFYPKRKNTIDTLKNDNDETTFSSQEKNEDLSLSNSKALEKRKFLDNIEILENNDNEILYKKVQENLNKIISYYKLNNRTHEIPNTILYYYSNNNQSYDYL